MKDDPVTSFIIAAVVVITSFAYLFMIFEKPYYTFNQGDYSLYNFGSFYNCLWVVVITMSSVGYGNIIAATTIGRGITMAAILTGACLLSLLVAIILGWFDLDENKQEAVQSLKNETYAVRAVKATFDFNTLRNKRLRLLVENPDQEYIPTI